MVDIRKIFCGNVKKIAFKVVDICNNKKEKELIVQEFTDNVEAVASAEHLLSYEDELRNGITNLEEHNQNLLQIIYELLTYYKNGEIDKLHKKLEILLRMVENEQ